MKNYFHTVKNRRQIKAETPLRNFKKIIRFVYKMRKSRKLSKLFCLIISYTLTTKVSQISTQFNAKHLAI